MVAIALASCSPQPTSGGASPSPSAAAACRLPVLAGVTGQPSAPVQAGFITLPGTTLAPDPTAAGGSFYDPALKRWVAERPPVLAADGLSYAFFDGGTKPGNLQLVDLQTGAYRLLATGGPWQVVGVGTDAVYIMEIEYVDSPAYGRIGISHGLWKVALAGGVPVRLTADPLYWSWVDSRGVYAAGSTTDVAGGPSPVVRYDFATGQAGMWFDSPARTRLLAVDANGTGFAISEGADEQLWRFPRTAAPVKIWSGPTGAVHPWGPVAVDGQDVWFSSLSSTSEWAIYHYSPAQGLKQVALFTDRSVVVAGACA